MTHIICRNLNVEFELPVPPARSLKRALLSSLIGGKIETTSYAGRVVHALRDLSFTLSAGDRVALIGANGAGKTTLLRTMASIYSPTSGSIDVSGHVMPLLDIGAGFDDEASGYENVKLRGLLLGWSRIEIERRMHDVAAFSGLGEYLDLPVRTYSNGMMVRLLFSIATSASADILIMDEWLAAGDAEFLEKANQRLRELVAASGILVLASHNLVLLKMLCNRALVLHHGELVFDGGVDEALATSCATPSALAELPASSLIYSSPPLEQVSAAVSERRRPG